MILKEEECIPDSSMIQKIEYQPSTSILTVIFNTGQIYDYSNIPAEFFDGLCQVDKSAGMFFNKNIRGKYNFVRRN